MSAEETSTAERILDAAEAVLRRHGAEKTNVVDIARALEMSHGNIYRHFPSKQALINAVAMRWLLAVVTPLEVIAEDGARPASERLEAWFETLRGIKIKKVFDDPELFRVHHQIVMKVPEVVTEHVGTLLRQLELIIADGVRSGEFSSGLDPAIAARAFLHASSPFHHPALLMQNRPSDAEAHAVFALLLAGLKAGAA
ncbi:MAG TPA: TetR/AcrR family transcriptional regulator [Chthoniobacterales bacterium]|jgi:AcrR family transcriptional regulator|nr:TetR/AcrR family transcriptional regulator [Chthoniobacterales bacterium]